MFFFIGALSLKVWVFTHFSAAGHIWHFYQDVTSWFCNFSVLLKHNLISQHVLRVSFFFCAISSLFRDFLKLVRITSFCTWVVTHSLSPVHNPPGICSVGGQRRGVGHQVLDQTFFWSRLHQHLSHCHPLLSHVLVRVLPPTRLALWLLRECRIWCIQQGFGGVWFYRAGPVHCQGYG